MTDALARQHIQRWTVQLAAPEYLGAHVSAPTSHQSGRTFSLDFRAATALFGSFGIEWNLTEASEDDLERLAEWVERYKTYRQMLQTGRTVRVDLGDETALAHGVIAADRRSALLAFVQLDESDSARGVELRIPGLIADQRYTVRWEGPFEPEAPSYSQRLDPAGPTGGVPVTGAVLADIGLFVPRRRPETVLLVHIEVAD